MLVWNEKLSTETRSGHSLNPVLLAYYNQRAIVQKNHQGALVDLLLSCPGASALSAVYLMVPLYVSLVLEAT